ncbi:apolipoprotein B receptor [Neomonachus schauinslandi]|uniref:Apolipoprotein B receptor n=1 Tax=Neomonachus schauinslandi TaxID=29088 RepID=A0A8M1MF56_NEOSC|nr:apolipoprotein B receptor [Neomonachus schauinslandi]
MDFLRLRLPGLHQALRGALDSLSFFVSYLMGAEVPTAERKEARAAEELGEVAAGRPGKPEEKEAQEALEGLGGSPNQEAGGLRGPGEAGRRQEGSSATEQTWGWEEGSSHGSQADRQDTGVWEAAEAARCQEPRAHLEARKESKAGSEAGRDNSSQAPESQGPNEQEVNREETPRTWEQEEEAEEGRERKPEVARKVESEWTWHWEPEGEVGADGQKVAGDSRGSLEQTVREAVAEEIQGSGAKETGKEEEVMGVLRGSQSTRAQEAWESGTESEDGTTSGREEDGTASGREEDSKASDRSGREEDGTTSGKEEDSTASGREEDGTASVREKEEEDRTASGREEAGITLVRVEARTTSVGKEGDLSGARKREYGEVSGERISEGTGRAWAFEEASRGDQEEEMDENREAEMSFSPKETQSLGTKGTEEATKDQTAAGEAAEGHGSEGEVGEGFEIQADEEGKEAEGRQASAIRTVPASPEEVVEAEKTKEEEEVFWASEAELPKDDVTNEAEGDADLEATLETSSPEKEFGGERSEGEAQTGGEAQGVEWGGLEHEITEGQEPELMAGPQTLTEQPEEGQGGEEELWGVSALSKEEMEGSLEEYPRKVGDVKPDAPGAEVWENQRRDVEGGDTQEEKADTEEGEEEAAGGQAPKEAQGGRESALPDVPEAGGEWKKAQDAGYGAEEGDTPGAESQELGGRHGADAGTGQSLGESDARETEDAEVEATVPWGADTTSSGDWRLEEAARSLQDSEDPGVSSLAAEIVRDKVALVGRAAGAGGGLEREAGEAADSKGKQEAGGGVELVEATWGENRGGPEFGLAGSADEKVAGRGGQAEALEAREGEPGGEWVEVREPAAAEGSCEMGGFISGSQVAKAEGTVATVEAEGLPGGQTLLEEEAVGWQMKEQGRGREGQCGDHHPEGEARRPPDVEDVAVTEDRRAQAEEIVPEGPEDVQGPEDQSTHQEPAEAEHGLHGETAASAGQGAGTSWSEALLPGSLLDVSVPRSRVLLSRNSSLRRSRPSSRRTGAPEQQEEPPRPPPEEEMSAREQRLLQPEEPPEPSPPKPEGTPLPARRRPLGHGFGLAHTGMMQELQARLGQPKPQGGP